MGFLWNIWLTFVGFLEQLLLLFASFTGNMGLGIVIFTVLARLAILPLTLKSIKSSRKMQELQPQLKELQRKYGKDQQRLSQEMMKLYKDTGVNPVGGCLPLLLQLPIFIAVYQAILHLMIEDQRKNLSEVVKAVIVENEIAPLLAQVFPLGPLWRLTGVEAASDITALLHQTFLGMDIGTPPFDPFPVLSGPQYLILPILAIVLLLLQQLMAMPRVQDPQQKMMSQMMMFIMPIGFAWVALTFPSGAAIYWVTTSLVGIIQQYFISGWGSLPNYLTFLPADSKVPTQPKLALATASAQGEHSPASPSEPEPRPTFWDVLRPLTESAVQAPASRADDDEAQETSDEPAETEPHHQEQPASATQRKTVQRSPKSRTNRKSSSRRRRS